MRHLATEAGEWPDHRLPLATNEVQTTSCWSRRLWRPIRDDDSACVGPTAGSRWGPGATRRASAATDSEFSPAHALRRCAPALLTTQSTGMASRGVPRTGDARNGARRVHPLDATRRGARIAPPP